MMPRMVGLTLSTFQCTEEDIEDIRSDTELQDTLNARTASEKTFVPLINVRCIFHDYLLLIWWLTMDIDVESSARRSRRTSKCNIGLDTTVPGKSESVVSVIVTCR